MRSTGPSLYLAQEYIALHVRNRLPVNPEPPGQRGHGFSYRLGGPKAVPPKAGVGRAYHLARTVAVTLRGDPYQLPLVGVEPTVW